MKIHLSTNFKKISLKVIHLADESLKHNIVRIKSKYLAMKVAVTRLVMITVDREIFALKIIRMKIFRVDKFLRFRSIREIYLTVADCNMDERLESLWLLVYYQVSGKPGIVRCSHRSGSVDLRASLFTEYRCVIYFLRV